MSFNIAKLSDPASYSYDYAVGAPQLLKETGGFSGEVRDSVTHDRHPADRFQCLRELFTPNCKSV